MEIRTFLNCKFILFQLVGCVFWSKPSSRPHPVNVTFYQLKHMLVVFLFVHFYLFILLANWFKMY